MRVPHRNFRLRVWLGLPRVRAAAGVVAALSALSTASALLLPAASPLSPVGVHADASFDSALLTLLNNDRTSRGLPPLQSSGPLQGVAESSNYGGCGYTVQGRAEDMLQRNYFSHTILNCGSQNVFSMMRAEGIPFGSAAENIGWASGISDPNAAAQYINDHFMASSEHEANILNSSFTTVGIGSWRTASGQTWSGAGSAQSNAIVVAVAFTDGPRTASAPAPAPPVHHSAAPAPARTSAANAAAPAAPLVQTPVPAMPITGVVLLLDDSSADAGAPVASRDEQPAEIYQTGARQVSAMNGQSPMGLAAGVGVSAVALLLGATALLRRRARRASTL